MMIAGFNQAFLTAVAQGPLAAAQFLEMIPASQAIDMAPAIVEDLQFYLEPDEKILGEFAEKRHHLMQSVEGRQVADAVQELAGIGKWIRGRVEKGGRIFTEKTKRLPTPSALLFATPEAAKEKAAAVVSPPRLQDPIAPLITIAKEGDHNAGFVLKCHADHWPADFKEAHFNEIVEGARLHHFLAQTLYALIEKRSDLPQEHRIPEMVAAGKENGIVVTSLELLATKRRALAAKIITGLLEIAESGKTDEIRESASRATQRLAELRPDFFLWEHLPKILSLVPKRKEMTSVLKTFAEKNPSIFTRDSIVKIKELAKWNQETRGVVEILKKKRPDLFPWFQRWFARR